MQVTLVLVLLRGAKIRELEVEVGDFPLRTFPLRTLFRLDHHIVQFDVPMHNLVLREVV